MYEGLCGWEGTVSLFEEAKACSIIFFDVKNLDTVSHVGILTKDTYLFMVNALAHASSSKGFIQVVIEKKKKDYWYIRSVGVKQLYKKRAK